MFYKQAYFDLGSEYRLSNALGRGAAIDSIIKVLGLWEYPEYRPPSLFFSSAFPPGWVPPTCTSHKKPRATGGSRPQALLCNIYHHPQPPSKCKGYCRICQEVYFFLFWPLPLHPGYNRIYKIHNLTKGIYEHICRRVYKIWLRQRSYKT